MKAENSPCRCTKEQLSEQLKGFLESEEYISDWEIDVENKLVLWIEHRDKEGVL